MTYVNFETIILLETEDDKREKDVPLPDLPGDCFDFTSFWGMEMGKGKNEKTPLFL